MKEEFQRQELKKKGKGGKWGVRMEKGGIRGRCSFEKGRRKTLRVIKSQVRSSTKTPMAIGGKKD